MKKFNVSKMSCAVCANSVEKAVSAVEGVTKCEVNLLTNSMTVIGTASSEDIIEAVIKAGYGAFEIGESKTEKAEVKNNTLKANGIITRLISSFLLLLILIYFSMGQTMFNLPLPSFFTDNYIAMGIVQLLVSAIIMIINNKFFVTGFRGLIKKSPNMDTLVSLGSLSSFVYSVCALFIMTGSQGDIKTQMYYFHELYFESAAMILVLITVGKLLEAYSKGKTTNAIHALMDLAPKTAIIYENGKEKEIPAKDIKKGDIFIVKSGGSIPADGIIIEGHASINEAFLTGESMPVDKKENDSVSAATINQFGFIKCEALKVGEDTTLSQIIKMVNDASSSKAPIAKTADKISGVFVPIVIMISIITFIVWLISGETVGFSLSRAISVLVISCPCALGLATPVSIMVGNGVGAKNGILFKNATALEQAGKIKVVALDKTGTITKGQPSVTDIIPLGNETEESFLKLAYSLEIKSEHPLSRAITKKAEEMKIEAFFVKDFEVLSGSGIKGIIDGKTVYGGNLKFIFEDIPLPKPIQDIYTKLASTGKTPMFFRKDKEIAGIIAVSDEIKDDSKTAIEELKKDGIYVVMLTGDNEKTANFVKEKTGVSKVIANVLPDGKQAIINEFKKKGKTAMVGDGINDAPALTTADIGIAIGAGEDVAIESADIVLMKNSLTDVCKAIRLSRKALKNIYENLFWAFIYNIMGIPLAMGVWIPSLGWKLSPMFGAFAMSLSSFFVVLNALRLNFVNLNGNIIKKENIKMEKTLKIEGMMCPHCEARVKKALGEIDGITEVIASHEKKTAVVKMEKDIPLEVLKSTVINAGYEVD